MEYKDNSQIILPTHQLISLHYCLINLSLIHCLNLELSRNPQDVKLPGSIFSLD